MAKNILIFSDGTSQAGGILSDEKRSNIYKLFRATRCGPDTDIDPGQQLTFYDAGLGSEAAAGAFFLTRAYRWLRKIASQATGLGSQTTSWTVRRNPDDVGARRPDLSLRVQPRGLHRAVSGGRAFVLRRPHGGRR